MWKKQGYQDAINGQAANFQAVPGSFRNDYLGGYRKGVDEMYQELQTFRTRRAPAPKAEIVLTVDAASYRTHAEEQDGDARELARNLKADALAAVSRLNLRHLADAILHGDACCVSERLRDPYGDGQDENDGENGQSDDAVRFMIRVVGA